MIIKAKQEYINLYWGTPARTHIHLHIHTSTYRLSSLPKRLGYEIVTWKTVTCVSIQAGWLAFQVSIYEALTAFSGSFVCGTLFFSNGFSKNQTVYMNESCAALAFTGHWKLRGGKHGRGVLNIWTKLDTEMFQWRGWHACKTYTWTLICISLLGHARTPHLHLQI